MLSKVRGLWVHHKRSRTGHEYFHWRWIQNLPGAEFVVWRRKSVIPNGSGIDVWLLDRTSLIQGQWLIPRYAGSRGCSPDVWVQAFKSTWSAKHERPGILKMKKRFKGIQIFLVIAISFFAPVSSTYGHYYSLAAADFISHNPKLENFDQEYLSAANQSGWKVFGSGGFLKGFHPLTCLFGQSFHLLSQVSSPDQKTLVLRC